MHKQILKYSQVMEAYGYKPLKKQDKYRAKDLCKIVNRVLGLINHLGIDLVYGKGKRKTEIQRLYDEIFAIQAKLLF